MTMGSLIVAAIHKQTGQVLIDEKMPAAYSAFHALSINPEEQSIELKSYNVRLRLVSTDDAGPFDTKSPPPVPATP